MKMKKIVLLLMLILLFIGVSYATDVSNDTINTVDTTDEVVQSSNKLIN